MRLYKDAYWSGRSKTNYFEGYYIRLVNQETNVAFIFGISYSQDTHAFIQVYDEKIQKMEYFRFTLDECVVKRGTLDIQIGKNRLTDQRLSVNVEGRDVSFVIDIAFDRFRTLYDRGYKSIMGPLLHLPGLECYHGVVSMYHRWSGKINAREASGYSYIEKDYGKSMPSDWIWLHLTSEEGVSFMVSIAKIPYLGLKPTGFLGFYSHLDQTEVFASYTGARFFIKRLDQLKIEIEIKTSTLTYIVHIKREKTVVLKAPVGGRMIRDIEESLATRGTLVIQDRKGKIVSEKDFVNGGCEVVGDAFYKEL